MNMVLVTSLLVTATIAFVVGGATGYHAGEHDGYRDGQIHALSGHAAYVLTTMPNGETVWKEKDGAK